MSLVCKHEDQSSSLRTSTEARRWSSPSVIPDIGQEAGSNPRASSLATPDKLMVLSSARALASGNKMKTDQGRHPTSASEITHMYL